MPTRDSSRAAQRPVRGRRRRPLHRRACGVAGTRRRAQRHGRHQPASRHQGRRRHPEAGRQRGRRRGRRRLRARRGVPRRRQPRRRRLHDRPVRRRAQDVHRFPRKGPAGRDGRHVPRPRRQRHPRREHQGLSRRRRSRQRGRIRAGARQVRHDEACGRHRAGHPPRATRLRAGARRRRPAGHRRGGSSRRRAVGRDLPRPAASRSRPDSASSRRTSARTLQLIARHGADGFYQGPIADAIVASSTRGNGIITKADLAQYQARERAPIECDYRGYRIVSAPPPELRRRDRLRNSGHSRGLPAAGTGLPLRAGRALPDRGHAARVRGSQQLPGRPGFRAQPDRAAARQGLRREDPRRDRPGQGGRVPRPQARRRAARRDEHHALLDRRQGRQRRGGHLHAERMVRREGDGGGHRHRHERRNGRLHRQARRAELLRPGAGRSQCDRARQAAVELDGAHHRDARRQARAGHRLARRQPHHHRRRCTSSSTRSTTA